MRCHYGDNMRQLRLLHDSSRCRQSKQPITWPGTWVWMQPALQPNSCGPLDTIEMYESRFQVDPNRSLGPLVILWSSKSFTGPGLTTWTLKHSKIGQRFWNLGLRQPAAQGGRRAFLAAFEVKWPSQMDIHLPTNADACCSGHYSFCGCSSSPGLLLPNTNSLPPWTLGKILQGTQSLALSKNRAYRHTP